MDIIREHYVEVIKSHVGMPYMWGSDNSMIGFDCSGLVCNALDDVGIKVQRTNAQGLYDHFKAYELKRDESRIGCLWFYGHNREKITHVMTVINRWYYGAYMLCGARGGDENTTSLDVAYKNRAYVDVVPGEYYSDHWVAAVDPIMGYV